MIAQKISGILTITALMIIALVVTGCRQSYAPIDESLATPVVEGESEFPATLASDMEGVFAAGAETSTAIAVASGAPTVNAALEPSATVDPAAGETATPSPTSDAPTSTLPVVATETVVPPTVIGGRPASYTLKKGEFPYCIARRFDIDPGELLSLNSLSSAQAQTYYPGMTLSIPQSGKAFPSARARNGHPVSYTVPANTTVYGVACYFGDVDPAAIMAKNTIPDPNNIAANTILSIP
ncbi:MAG: LysM peptidoglycan-binding domain-containing protein [Anaerolineae bacterium]|jgi:LysM repeat protein|nr:LysM peptidoglycan-binding domain-containing protein [Anaerolineae bacterium]MBT3711751.1 LysM peptidoglycan-binding domain-containing protein [Anaerolineae bacterium]MBT4311273.1 LysM peptidoglycan-binding domain-containing protein [Anaerolineae bacterium]MBT4457112.1 LysM peptidoglycan-binding domain-containing protein [Anaerolineae bacterium]MBT4841803.1 LysM peptidoglycan-binding domain-containing protein [Anaerolineae bacterium]